MKWREVLDIDMWVGILVMIVIMIVTLAVISSLGFSFYVLTYGYDCPDAVVDYDATIRPHVALAIQVRDSVWWELIASNEPCADSIAVLNEQMIQYISAANSVVKTLETSLAGSGMISIAAVEKCIIYHIDWVPTYGSDTSGAMWCGPPYLPDKSASIDFDKWRDLKQTRGL